MPATIRQIKSKYRVTTPRGTKAKKITKASPAVQEAINSFGAYIIKATSDVRPDEVNADEDTKAF